MERTLTNAELIDSCLSNGESMRILHSVAEVADYASKPVRTVENWIQKGLPRHKVGKNKFEYYSQEVEKWINKNIQDSPFQFKRNTADFWMLKYMVSFNEALRLRQFVRSLPDIIQKIDETNSRISKKELKDVLSGKTRKIENDTVFDLGVALSMLEEFEEEGRVTCSNN